MAAKFETVQRLQEGLQGKVGMCASFIMIINLFKNLENV